MAVIKDEPGNRKIGEWDSLHGELEVYGNHGRNHEGSYDPKTGKKKGKQPHTNRKSRK